MSAGIAFPVFLFLFFDTPSVYFKIFSVLVAIALINNSQEKYYETSERRRIKTYQNWQEEKNRSDLLNISVR